jgi:hypothetical protein
MGEQEEMLQLSGVRILAIPNSLYLIVKFWQEMEQYV